MTMADIRTTVAPNLPTAPAQYSQQHQSHVLNALRLYFSTVDTTNSQNAIVAQSTNVLNWMGL